jgi:chemotaxis protein MotD
MASDAQIAEAVAAALLAEMVAGGPTLGDACVPVSPEGVAVDVILDDVLDGQQPMTTALAGEPAAPQMPTAGGAASLAATTPAAPTPAAPPAVAASADVAAGAPDQTTADPSPARTPANISQPAARVPPDDVLKAITPEQVAKTSAPQPVPASATPAESTLETVAATGRQSPPPTTPTSPSTTADATRDGPETPRATQSAPADDPARIARKPADTLGGRTDERPIQHAPRHVPAAPVTEEQKVLVAKPIELSAPQQPDLQPTDIARSGAPQLDPVQVNSAEPIVERIAGSAAASTRGAASTQPALSPTVSGLAVEIASRAQAGRNRFEIRLDPPELGRVDVRLDIDRHGYAASRLVVERMETLELLRRDAAHLERALEQAGVKMADNGLQFALRDQAFAEREGSADRDANSRIVVADEEMGAAETITDRYGRILRQGGGIDIRV